MGNPSIASNKKTKYTDNGVEVMLTSEGQAPQEMMARRENNFVKDVEDTVPSVPDVASVIEDLLEQSSKVFTQILIHISPEYHFFRLIAICFCLLLPDSTNESTNVQSDCILCMYSLFSYLFLCIFGKPI